MKFFYEGERCYHPGAGIDLVPGEMEITEAQAEQLVGLVQPSERRTDPTKEAAPARRKRGESPEKE